MKFITCMLIVGIGIGIGCPASIWADKLGPAGQNSTTIIPESSQENIPKSDQGTLKAMKLVAGIFNGGSQPQAENKTGSQQKPTSPEKSPYDQNTDYLKEQYKIMQQQYDILKKAGNAVSEADKAAFRKKMKDIQEKIGNKKLRDAADQEKFLEGLQKGQKAAAQAAAEAAAQAKKQLEITYHLYHQGAASAWEVLQDKLRYLQALYDQNLFRR